MSGAEERTAVITGGSRGLGLALASGLAGRGWKVIITAREGRRLDAAREQLARLTRVAAIAGDVSDSSHRAELARLAKGFGGVDAVINNAGILGPSPQPRLLEYPLDVLSQVYATNVIAPLGVLQALNGVLKPGARIVNVSSDAAIHAYAGWGGYGSSKAALEQLSAVLAVEHPELRVYWVDPGDLRTDMQRAAFPGEDISDRPLPETRVPEILRLLEEELPSGRYVASALTPSAVGV